MNSHRADHSWSNPLSSSAKEIEFPYGFVSVRLPAEPAAALPEEIESDLSFWEIVGPGVGFFPFGSSNFTTDKEKGGG
jgi:hypothetical protein